MSVQRTIGFHLFLSALFLLTFTAHAAEPSRLEITGDYRYKAHQFEPTADAKNLACREAFRLAVVNSTIYREQTASVVDSVLLRELAYTLATRVEDQQILEQTEQILEQIEKGRILYCRVKGYLATDESARVIRTQLSGGPIPAEGLDQNRVLRLLSVKEESPGMLTVQYQALKRLDWIGTHYQGGFRESADIMVDFYDDQGFLIHSERYQARRTATGEDVMSAGAIGMLQVAKPVGAKTYRVWLVK
jgi:hypothetical protein